MSELMLSRHAETRMRQRGIGHADLDLIVQCGSEIGDDVFFLTRKDVDREIRRCKRKIQNLERLRGQKIVVADDTVVTCYKSRPDDQKTMFRRARERK